MSDWCNLNYHLNTADIEIKLMLFETLVLRPVSGNIDVGRVSAWLDALPYSFYDPIDKDSWHLRATPRLMIISKQQRINNPNELQLGIRIWVAPDEVYLTSLSDLNDLTRGIEFVQWLMSNRKWMATVDGVDIGVIDDPRQLFPTELPDPMSLIDDLTISPVTTGRLVTWSTDLNGKQRIIAIHSSGQCTYETRKRKLKGQLSLDTISAWNTAMELIDPNDQNLPDHPQLAHAVSMDIETPEGTVWAYFDTIDPPATYCSIIKMVTKWTASLDQWVPGTQVDDITEIHDISVAS